MKNIIIAMSGILLLLAGWGCTPSVPADNSSSSATTQDITTSENSEREDTVEQNAVVRGQTRLTKGDQIMVNDIFLSSQQVKMTSLTEEQLAGKTIELKGDVATHYCGKYNQCLGGENGNYLKYLKNIEYIKIVE